IRELETCGTLRVLGRGDYQVLDGDALLRLWVDAHAAKLGPALLLGRYATAVDSDFGFLIQQARAELAGDVVIGGEVAADMLTQHLRPGLLRLYLPEDRAGDVRRKLRLAPSEHGTVELCALYSPEIAGTEPILGVPVVDPVFVYAELMADGASRLAETAVRLRQKHLAWTL
ncbi:MAG: type IV toxin-antitoxin system AbiEi family antitoxin, partial [Steroidobacteraceae bacterium]|nr:type IV toxin-antitoxin system AbiEi family antitoxin [Steroidobacteraceae bacterium]